MASILATQPRSPLPTAGKWSVLEEQHVCDPQEEAEAPATCSPGLSHIWGQCRTAPGPPITGLEPRLRTGSNKQCPEMVIHPRLRAMMWAVQVQFADKQLRQSLAQKDRARGLQAGPPTFPETLGTTQSAHSHLFFCTDHPGSL